MLHWLLVSTTCAEDEMAKKEEWKSSALQMELLFAILNDAFPNSVESDGKKITFLPPNSVFFKQQKELHLLWHILCGFVT